MKRINSLVLITKKNITETIRKKIKKYTKAYYDLNKIQMKQKRKGNTPVKRKPKENGMLFVTYTEVTMRFD